MAQYNFEGVIDDLTEPQKEFIYKTINEHGFKNSKVLFEPVGKAGDNFIADVKRLTIQHENGSSTMVAKLSPIHEMARRAQNSQLLFKNEHIMYTEVLPKFVQLQKEAGVPEEEHFRYPKCYGSYSEYPHEVILLEDLKSSDFTMLDKIKPLPNDCITSVLKNLAVLHSMAHVCRHKEPDTYKKFQESLVDMVKVDAVAFGSEFMSNVFKFFEKMMLALLEDPEDINVAKDKVMAAFPNAVKLAETDKDSEHNVIVQGDAWTNNLMFRFEDGKPISIMIDYQRSRNCNPVYDIMFMIFNGSDHEERKDHFYEWIDYYHSELGKSLAYFDLDVNSIYPRDALDADLKKYGNVMFGFCLGINNMLVRKSEDTAMVMAAIHSDNMEERLTEILKMRPDEETVALFRSKTKGLIDSFNQFNLL
ncbi:uncharacterized protein LOC142980667 [Anticarsia gemmatalis]|uniref:uncharacterized protein LOC142980667 n=1 Tax=Anticarsia gemmatalis TaxID=129554 RepID=UPI003F775718